MAAALRHLRRPAGAAVCEALLALLPHWRFAATWSAWRCADGSAGLAALLQAVLALPREGHGAAGAAGGPGALTTQAAKLALPAVSLLHTLALDAGALRHLGAECAR